MATAPSDRAIVVGVGRYLRLGPRGTPRNLSGPARDATEVADWLQGQGAHVTLVTSDGSPEGQWTIADLRPESADIERQLNKLVDDAEDLRNQGLPVRLGRRLTIYMAGHGFAPNRNHLALLTAEASEGRMASLSATDWVDWLVDQTHFEEIVLWMDCCTVADYALPSRGPLGVRKSRRENGTAKMVTIWATGPDQLAYEREDADGVVRGVFTAELLKALGGAAAGNDRRVTTSSLMEYFQGRGLTGEEEVTTEPDQALTPHFRDRDEIVFSIDATWPRYRIHTGLAPGAEVSVLRGGTETYYDDPVGPGGIVEVQLPPGLYKVRGGGRSKLFEIGAGSEVDVHPR